MSATRLAERRARASAPTIHWPVTHGPLPPGGTNAQPATAYGAAIVATGCPLTGHARVRRGRRRLAAVRAQHGGAEVEERARACQITVSAPVLMVTVGPVMTIDAPLPFWM